MVALDGRLLRSAREITAEAERRPPGALLHYTVARGHEVLERDIPTGVVNRMVDVRPRSAKLLERARRLVSEIGKVYEQA